MISDHGSMKIHMPLRRSVPRRVATVLLACTVPLAGCEHRAAPVPAVIEEAPYQITDGNVLKVRPDIAEALHFNRVEKTSVTAEVHGVGEVDFTPGALTALRIPFEGIIESVEVAAGAKVARDDVLAKIRSSELARMRAEVHRINAELEGQYDARRRIQDLVQGDVPLTGRVLSVVRAIDRQKRTVDVTCSFDAVTPGVRAHMLAHVTVAVQGEPQLVVPRGAVLLDGELDRQL